VSTIEVARPARSSPTLPIPHGSANGSGASRAAAWTKTARPRWAPSSLPPPGSVAAGRSGAGDHRDQSPSRAGAGPW